MERKLVTIEDIKEIKPIEGAEKIEAARVRDWWVVVKKDTHKVGEKVLYYEIDSLLPLEEKYQFLLDGNRTRRMMVDGEEREGILLKTKKLRGFLSQGLIMPLDFDGEIGDDVTEKLGVLKYEKPIPLCMQNMARGNFPSFLRKTDEERCLSAETLIITEDGIKTIQEICETEYHGKVLSYNIENNTEEYNTINDWLIRKNNNDWYEIELEDGSKVKATSNHKIWLSELGCYRNVRDLSVGDIVLKTK
jgi:hypothetical protein